MPARAQQRIAPVAESWLIKLFIDELHQLVDLEQEGDRDLDLGELEHELRGVLVELREEATP